MRSLDDLRSRLRSIRSLRFEASSGAATGWDGVGVGTVAVSEPSDGVIVFDESGEWRPLAPAPGQTAVRFTNVFRWTIVGDALRLEHLRFGVDRPVFLFDLARGNDGTWREVAPHQCAADRYGATLSVVDDQLIVAWSIDGPRKRESIRYTYS